MDIQEIFERLKTAEGYMVAVSLLSEEGKIQHFLLTENFQYLDMLPSNEEVKKMIVEQLEVSNEQV